MRKKAFTLIEILVVVFIFGVGILAILQLLTRSLGYFDAISMRTKANILAKEGMEIVYNWRESNLEQGLPWNFFNEQEGKLQLLGEKNLQSFQGGFTGGKEYWIFKPQQTEWAFESDFKTFYLELFTGDEAGFAFYAPKPQEEMPLKGFARIISLEPIVEGEEQLDTNKLLKLSSRVLYKRGSRTGEVLLESFIGMKDSLPVEISSAAQ